MPFRGSSKPLGLAILMGRPSEVMTPMPGSSDPLDKIAPALDDETFEGFASADYGLVAIAFHAGPSVICQLFMPTIKSLADEFLGQIRFFRVEVDDAPKTSVGLNIGAVPLLLLMRGGREVERIMGVFTKEEMRDKLVRRLLSP